MIVPAPCYWGETFSSWFFRSRLVFVREGCRHPNDMFCFFFLCLLLVLVVGCCTTFTYVEYSHDSTIRDYYIETLPSIHHTIHRRDLQCANQKHSIYNQRLFVRAGSLVVWEQQHQYRARAFLLFSSCRNSQLEGPHYNISIFLYDRDSLVRLSLTKWQE